MCGIVGYIGTNPAAPLLLEGLEKLEYRGYDSAGVALLDTMGMSIYKKEGRLQVLSDLLRGGTECPQRIGIGHTRWATHGAPSDTNAHPHTDADGRFAVVHNGIIENYLELREELQNQGVRFASETDTEVIAQLLAQYYDGDLFEAIQRTLTKLKGSYALGILSADNPHILYGVRNASPLIVGVGEKEYFLASDVTAVLNHTRRVISLMDHDIIRLTTDGVTVWDGEGRQVDRPQHLVDWDVEAAEKGGYDHYMLKEIMEQPAALNAALTQKVVLSDDLVKSFRKMAIVACGSAYHAGVVGKYYLEKLVGLPVEVDLASEFRYREPLVDEHTLTVIISQSGETADTLAALREAKQRGSYVLSIVNVVGSTIAVESDEVLYTRAGPEIAVATTKGYTTQVMMLYRLGLYMAESLGRISAESAEELKNQLCALPLVVEEATQSIDNIRLVAADFLNAEHVYFIGRNVDYAVALEASLKLKEISYIHSEAYAAGELKHGTISLIEEGTLVVAIACHAALVEKIRSNIKEVKARGAKVIVVTTSNLESCFPETDTIIRVPQGSFPFMAIPEMIPLQLLSYYIALARGCDIDKPRNLAKSVTVE